MNTPVFVFDDYVDYLQAWYGYAKRFRLTQKAFVAKAGVGTQAFFSDILSRRKKLPVRFIEGFLQAMELTGDEALFFTRLVMKEHAKAGTEKERVLKHLAQLREKHLSVLVTGANTEYYSSWKYPVIREYIVTCGNVASLHDIKKAFLHFTMPTAEVRRVVERLVEWNMVEYRGPGTEIRPCVESGTVTYTGMPHAVVNDVKRLFIESALHAMETLPREERHITMAVKGVSRKKYEAFCRKIDALREQFLTEDDPGEADEYVYGLTIQLYPLMAVKPESSAAAGNDAGVQQVNKG